MDFSNAVSKIMSGEKVRRCDWNRPNFVHAVFESDQKYLQMVMKNGVRAPYTPSHCDMFASDWIIVNG